MSVPTTSPGSETTIAAEPRFRIGGSRRMWYLVSLALVAMSATRLISGADDITSEGTLRAAMVAAVPIALAGLGGLWSERAGVVNIGLEGMMILGTLGAGYFGYHYGPWAGLLGAIVLGAFGGVLHAVTTVIFGVDHIVSGVAINIIAAGGANFLAEAMFSDLPGGGPTQSPGIDRPFSITIPGVSDGAQALADRNWFLVSDVADLVASLTNRLSIFTVIAWLLVFVTWWVLWRTAFGLRLRSCGESPTAAESLGVDVIRYKFVAVTISGGFAGAGGAYLAMIGSSGYQNGQTIGLGYIGLAAMIFGNWKPLGTFLGALLFGYTYATRLRQGGESVHGLLLLVAVALIGLAIYRLYQHGVTVGAVVTAVIGGAALWWYLVTDAVPGEFTEMTPYVATLLVLAMFSQQLRMPAADGQIYRRGSAG